MELKEFYETLNASQRAWFLRGFPQSLRGWYGTNYNAIIRNGKDPGLELTANPDGRYTDVNQIAVGLLHLKQIFPFKIPPLLYRLTNLDPNVAEQVGEEGPIKVITSTNSRKPLLSFTSKPVPYVDSRKGVSFLTEGILTWKPNSSQVLGCTTQLIVACDKIIAFLLSQNKQITGWHDLRRQLGYYLTEREYLVYVQPSKPLKCKWNETKPAFRQ